MSKYTHTTFQLMFYNNKLFYIAPIGGFTTVSISECNNVFIHTIEGNEYSLLNSLKQWGLNVKTERDTINKKNTLHPKNNFGFPKMIRSMGRLLRSHRSHDIKAFWSFKSQNAICITNNRASSRNSSKQMSTRERKDLFCNNFDSTTASEETLPTIKNVSWEDPCIYSRNKVMFVKNVKKV